VPLLSAVLFNLDREPEACSMAKILTELSNEKRRSLELGQIGVAVASSPDVSVCYGVSSPDIQPRFVLLWASGQIHGWLSCHMQRQTILGCRMFLYPPPADRNTENQVSVEIDGLSKTAVVPALEHASKLAARVSNLVAAHSGHTYGISSTDYIADFDEATRNSFK